MNEGIKEMIETHRRLHRKLKTIGGPEQDGELFEEILVLEEDILSVLELPPAQRYRDLLWGDDVEAVALSLDEARSAYLDRPIKDPVLVLVDAVLRHRDDPYNLLPVAGFTTHEYQLFMFSEKLLHTQGPTDTDAILAEMRLAEEHLLDIAVVRMRGIMSNPALYWKLREEGLECLDEFLITRGGFDLDDDDMDARQFFMRGTHYSRKGDSLSALRDLTACIWLDPGSDLAYYNRGVVQEELGDSRRAVEDYSHALLLDPHFNEALCNRGSIYAREGHPGRAVEDFSRVIGDGDALTPSTRCPHPPDPPLPEYRARGSALRGQVYADLGRHDEAVEDFTRALTLGVDEADMRYRRGLSLRALGNEDRAREDFEKAAELGSDEARGAMGYKKV